MKISLLIFSLCFLLILAKPYPVLSQEVELTKVLPLEDKPWGLITSITQDRQGYMWFGCQDSKGLYRYDGYHLIQYRHDRLNPNSLAENNIDAVYADSAGIIWIGTNGGGLDRMDPATGNFKHYRYNAKDLKSLSNDIVTAILKDKQGIMWIGTNGGGLNRFDPKTGKSLRYQHIENDPSSLSNNLVAVIYEDQQGTLWVGTGNPWKWDVNGNPWLQEAPALGGGLNQLNRNTGKFTKYLHDNKDSNSLIDNRVGSIFEDSRGTFWVGTAGDGLHTMDRAKGTFERHLFNPTHPEKLSRAEVKKVYPWADDYITFIKEDASGAIWIGTMQGGLNRYDPITKKISHYKSTNESNGLFDYDPRNAYSSRDGVFWISTFNRDLYRINPLKRNLSYFSSGFCAFSMYEEAPGMFWIATETEGLVRDDRIHGNKKEFLHDPLRPTSIRSNTPTIIRVRKDGKLWVGTISGLDLFDPKTEAFTHYHLNPGNNNNLDNEYISGLCEAENSNLWIGTGKGLYLMNNRTGNIQRYLNNPNDRNSLSQDSIGGILEDRQRNVWVGTFGNGVNQLNRQTGKFKHYLTGETITSSIYEDANGTIWVGTEIGLYRFDKVSGYFLPFSSPSFSKTAAVLYIFEDIRNYLWVVTTNELFRINPSRHETIRFGKSQGVHRNTYLAGDNGCKGIWGTIFFGDQAGYYVFQPDQLSIDDKPPQILLSDFLLDGKQVLTGEKSPITGSLQDAREIRLNYNQNVFSFDYTAIHYNAPEENRIVYKLENYDNSWREGGSYGKASYFKVPPGRYILKLKAENSNGVSIRRDLVILITPPWWSMWWAFVMYGFFAFSSTYVVYRNHISQFKKKQVAQIKVVIATQEEERKRISRDLHDDIGTKLSALKLYLSSLHEKALATDDEEIKSLAASSEQFIKEVVKDVRQLLINLSPSILEEFGYTTAVEGLVNKINETHLIHFNLVVFGMKQRLQKEYELSLYRITQELINNVLKHAEAKYASLQIGQRDEKIILMMEDDGKGFDVNAHNDGYGLKNLEARTKLLQGTMTIDSNPGKGTNVQIEIPYNLT